MKSLITVQKISKVFSILAKIGYIFAIVGTVISLIGGVALLCAPQLIDYIADLPMPERTEIDKLVKELESNKVGIGLIASSIVLIGQTVAAWFTVRYFKNELTDGTPFTHRGAKELLKVGIINLAVPLGALCIAAVINAIVKTDDLFYHSYDISAGITMILLSFVFHYGADLAEGEKTSEDADH